MGLFSFLTDGSLKKALREGALIVDVRTPREYDGGRIPESLNIPLERLSASDERLRGIKRPLVLVCSDGSRSREALQLLKSKGVKNLYHGGNWTRVMKLLRDL